VGALGLGYGNYAYEWNGEARFIKAWSRGANTSAIIFDVGANEGDLTTLFDKGTIYAFEPHPETFRRLSDRFRARPSVCPVNVGLGASRCRLTLFDMPGDGSDQATLVMGSDPRLTEGTDIEVDTVDDWCLRNGIERIDFLKMDVEGFEPEVFKGAARMIREKRIGTILFEMNHHNVRTGFTLLRAIETLPYHRIHRLLPTGMVDVEAGRGYRAAFDIYRLHNLVAIPR
jgi:FkbM family methyltransferase